MNRHQQRVVLLFGLLMISAALLGRAHSLEAQALAEHSAGEAYDPDRGLVLTLGDVVFDAGKASLQPGAMTAIDRLAQLLSVYPERSIRIEGHTDSVGDDATNQQLPSASCCRARRIARAASMLRASRPSATARRIHRRQPHRKRPAEEPPHRDRSV
jgi:flagellar motor protein MotB